MGNDLSVANAARVSFDKKHERLTEGDKKLIRYLAKHGHWTPFAHTALSVSPDDKHYGAKGSPTKSVYSQCKHYFDFDEPDKQAFRDCVNAEPPAFLMGEGTAALKEQSKSAGLPWRRGTFNPDYAHMEAKLFQFLNMIEGQ